MWRVVLEAIPRETGDPRGAKSDLVSYTHGRRAVEQYRQRGMKAHLECVSDTAVRSERARLERKEAAANESRKEAEASRRRDERKQLGLFD